ncbi:hypothetical protein PGT21_019851 [Puccinia graminis f. sp. tritici]|uniref:allantoinase n=1 Tax=Puccinia graminis f. sp. tritici TaxID=56615 RepID=A0A5B0Q6C4_PUCGR|nr:hypothetical protein PGT21_019851 [Puccinia graminis f. sp. tritici]
MQDCGIHVSTRKSPSVRGCPTNRQARGRKREAMKTMPRPSTVRQVVYAIERAMLPSLGGRTVDGTAERPSEAQEERFSEPQPATIEASIDTGLITAIRPGIVPRESYGADSVEYHLLPAPLIVFPGLVDPHVHLNEPGRTDWEGFETGTNAAAAGGVTTLVDMPLNAIPPTTTLANLNEKVRAAEGQCLVDVAFWGGVIPGNQDDLLPLVKAGVKGFKCFLIDSGVDEFPCVSAEDLEKSMAILQDAESMLMFHGELDCGEEGGTSAELLKESQAQDPNLYASFLGSRAPKLELDAIELIIRLNKKYPNLRTHVVHLSAADALPMIREARTTHGLPLTTETCLHYLTLSTEEIPDGRAEYKCCPPIRTAANGDKLWEGLEEGTIDFVVSDHSPCTPELKETGSLMDAWGGIGGLGLGLSLLWTEGRKRAVSHLEGRLLKWLCERPASFASLDGHKGSLAPGYQCDLCIFDPNLAFQVTKEDLKFKNKISAYIGKHLSGRVVSTVLATRLVYDIEHLVSAPVGPSERLGMLLLNRN